MEFWDDRLRRILAGRYELDRLLGRGGSSLVFLAEDLKLRRMVAIKVLRKEVVACSGTDRFEREMRIAASLQHPHIVPLYDFENEEGMPYYVMPYVQAPTLWDRIKAGARFDTEEALTTVRAVASALDCAHQHGVTHRDVSPTNIFDLDGHALLFDFGIAVMRNEEVEERPLTAPSHCLGTAHYMSPEQASGEAPADGRSDQYSLACVLYEMVAGRPPFMGTDHAVMTKHIHESPVPLSQQCPEVDESVCATVSRALAKSPNDRFATILGFASELTGGHSRGLRILA
jgi:eukaryotic-like serine/threonine-protein kinase